MATWHWEGLVVATPLVHSQGEILWLLHTGLMSIQGQALAESSMEQQLIVIFWRGQSLKWNPPRGGISIQQGSLLLHGIMWATTTDTTTWSVSASMCLFFCVLMYNWKFSSLLIAAKQLPGCDGYRRPQHLCAVYLQRHPLDNWWCLQRKEWLWWLRCPGRYQLWCWQINLCPRIRISESNAYFGEKDKCPHARNIHSSWKPRQAYVTGHTYAAY